MRDYVYTLPVDPTGPASTYRAINSLAYWLRELGWKRIQLMLLSIYGDYGEETCWVAAVVYV